MISTVKLSVVFIAIGLPLMACQNLDAALPKTDMTLAQEAEIAAPLVSREAVFCNARETETSIDAYKRGVANHISRTNLGSTFEGRLPPMLPAIVVLRISVNSEGRVTDLYVQRSRDNTASLLAMESIRRSGTLPSPCGLIKNGNRVLSFSETFLFNDQYQFQLRSLAAPQ